MKKEWTGKDGRKHELEMTVEKTTMKEKLGCLATIAIVGLILYFLIK